MSKPIRTWRAAASILGMSEDTLQRHRRQHNDQHPTPPWFRDDESVIAWYQAMRAPKAPSPKPSRKRSPRTDRPFDPAALRAELAGVGK